MAALTHSIVPVLEVDVQGLQPYIVLEYAPGRTLKNTWRSRDGAPHEAVALMVDVLEGLQAAHVRYRARNLKPSNVMVDNQRHARG